MVTEIKNWLENPKRKYADGFAIFEQLATAQQKSNFLEYLRSGLQEKSIAQFDSRFSILINQVVFIQKRVKINPSAFAVAKKKTGMKVVEIGGADAPAKITDINQLPPELAPLRTRLSELVPVMAKVHAEMANESLADDKRAVLRAELISLDNERRNIWTQIDQFVADGAPAVDKSELEQELENNLVKMGADTMRRIQTLRTNITRSNTALAKHEAAGNTKKADEAKARIEKYSAELKELEGIVN